MSALDGRTALITGAGSGIGRATALALAGQGARVVLVGRGTERLESLAAEIGERARVCALDLADVDAYARLDREVDILVHGAAAFAEYAPVENTSDAALADVLDTSLGAALRLARHCMPAMKARGFGRLLFLGSAAARDGAAGQAVYAAAKAGLGGLVRSLAVEAGSSGVTANLLELGLVDTERTRIAVTGDVRTRLERGSALGRAGTPQEVAAVITFLASPAASYVTGATLAVDGGLGLGVVPPRGDA